MTVDSILSAICTYFNASSAFDIRFIKSPTNAAAPKGNYIAVKMDSIAQTGEMMHPANSEGYHFLNAATLAFIEVEGDGENIRKVRNEIQSPAFRANAETNNFTVWDIGNIIETPTYDGEFYVRQWRMIVRVNFSDEVSATQVKIQTVSPITLTGV